MNLEQVVKHIIDGDAVLFLGAGFSREATNISNKKMKDASDFSVELCKEMKVRDEEDLGKVSNLYLGKKQDKDYYIKAQKLITKLQNYFICAEKGYSDSQKTIVLQDWMRIYTTNYDDVVERIFEDAGREIVPMTLKNSQSEIIQHNSIIHLNGMVRNLDVDKLDNEFKLVTRSYLVEDFNQSEVKYCFQQDLKNARAIIFVGTSLKYDLDIQRVVYSIDDIQDKVIFIDREFEKDEFGDVFEINGKELLGKLFFKGTKGFADEIKRVAQSYKKSNSSVIFRSFREISGRKMVHRDVTTQNMWNLLTIGKIDPDVLYAHIDDGTYMIHRDIGESIIKNIENQKGKVHIIHSGLGNGKTCLMQYLMYRFASSKKVFEYVEQYPDFEKECKKISEIEEDKILFFENYNLCLSALKKMKGYIDSSCTLVVSCRTFLNFNMFSQLIKVLGKTEEDFFEYDVDTLSDSEKEKIVDMLHNMKVAEFKDIGKKQGFAKLKKYNQWADVVIFYFNSELVSEQLNKIYRELAKDSNKLLLVLGCIVNNIVGLNLLASQLYELLEIQQGRVGITRNPYVNELIGNFQGRIQLRSSILSLYFIRKNSLYHDIIEVMSKMVKNSDRLSPADAENIKRQLISISNISELFYKSKLGLKAISDDDLQDEILDYFGEISDVVYYKRNQFFWLQYAMACMDLKKYEMAENHFKLAYEYASKKNRGSYQIDVQYGRFLLEKGCYSDIDGKNAFKIFEEAHKLWQKVLNDRDAESYYVYKQVAIYEQFIRKYMKYFNANEFNRVNKMIDTFIRNIERNQSRGVRWNEINNGIQRLKEAKDYLWNNFSLGEG